MNMVMGEIELCNGNVNVYILAIMWIGCEYDIYIVGIECVDTKWCVEMYILCIIINE